MHPIPRKPLFRLLSLSTLSFSTLLLVACGTGTLESPESSTASTPVKPSVPVAMAVPVIKDIRESTKTESDEAVRPALEVQDSRQLVEPSASPVHMEKKLGMTSGLVAAYDIAVPQYQGPDTERYQALAENPIHRVSEQPVSTFSIDVDTQAYANIRRLLNEGRLPSRDATRIEEMLNYFSYDYTPPRAGGAPFSVTTEMAPSPWSDKVLLSVGLQGYAPVAAELPPANLVFLVDVSGSMQAANKLPLLKRSLQLLVNQLRPQDRVAIAVYAGAEGIALAPTAGDHKGEILQALEQLEAGGSTNGEAGITLAYRLARQGFRKDGINRVILASDGDFNVGIADVERLKDLIRQERESGVGFSTLAFGVGNTNFELMEQLADNGNGSAAYIDTLQEANKVLVTEMGSTLMTIAKDVKIQVEFNPAVVQEYRLIGYENRLLREEDFRNDKVDAGDIGAGHRVTALYELSLVGGVSSLEPRRYIKTPPMTETNATNKEVAFVKLRYKAPNGHESTELNQPVERSRIKVSFAEASENFRFAGSVAAFGEMLRGGEYVRPGFDYAKVATLAAQAKGQDPFGYRGEFVQLVRLAESLARTSTQPQG